MGRDKLIPVRPRRGERIRLVTAPGISLGKLSRKKRINSHLPPSNYIRTKIRRCMKRLLTLTTIAALALSATATAQAQTHRIRAQRQVVAANSGSTRVAPARTRTVTRNINGGRYYSGGRYYYDR